MKTNVDIKGTSQHTGKGSQALDHRTSREYERGDGAALFPWRSKPDGDIQQKTIFSLWNFPC